MRNKCLRVRFNDLEWDMLQRLASKESLPVPDYIRFLVRRLDAEIGELRTPHAQI